jgi:hypothetical protein
VLDILDDLDAGFDRAHEADLHALGDEDLEKGWQRAMALVARAEALAARLAATHDSRGIAAGAGARSTAAYAATRFALPIEVVRRPLRLGRALRSLPGVERALAAGSIQRCHVDAILACDTPRTHEALVAEHVAMVRWAMSMPWRQFRHALVEWLEASDPDGPEPADPARRFHCSRSYRGGWALDGWLPAVDGSIFARELDRLERLLHDGEKAAKREALGREPLEHELERTPAQRRADALVLMAERSAVRPDQARRGRVVLVVHVGHAGFERICRLTNGIEVRPGEVVDRLADSWIQRILFDGEGEPVEVSDQRLFRGKLRRAIEARDQHCQFPYCEEPIDRCQVDHRIPASAGGPTARWNGRLGCGPHNRGRHERRCPSTSDGEPP